MNCPTCNAPFCAHGGTTTTLLGYGCRGDRHVHDDNCHCRFYECSNGHLTRLSVRRKCEEPEPCDWRGKTSCGCHSLDKLEQWPDEDNPLPIEWRLAMR
jgi:hypothetical protein